MSSERGIQWQRRLQHVRVRTKIVVPMVILAVGPAVFIGLFMISSIRTSLRTAAIERVRFDAASKARAIRESLDVVQEDLRFLAQMEAIRDLAGAEAAGASERLRVLRGVAERELVIFAQGKSAYYQVRYLDGTGREVIRLNLDNGQAEVVPQEHLQDKSDRYYVREALKLDPGQIYVSPMDLNIEHGKVELPYRGVVRYAARVRGTDGEARGLVVINVYADYILSLLGPLPSGTEAWLADENGGYLGYVGDSETRRALYGLENKRGLWMDYSQEQVSAILQHQPEGSVMETVGAFLSFAPIALYGGSVSPPWTLLIAYPRAPIDTPIRQLTALLSVVLALAVLIAGVLGVMMGTYLARPIAKLRRATREIAAGDLSRHVHITTGDELEGLASDFNVMTERLRDAQERLSAWNEELEREVARQTDELHQLQTALARADKMASIGQMTAGVMHEVGNPLAAIKTKIQVAEEEGTLCSNCNRLVSEILTEVDRLATFLRSFSRLARMREPRMDEASVAEVVRGVMTLVGPVLRRRNMLLRVESAGDVPLIRGDAEQLRQLLINLILNAMDASSCGGEVLVRVRGQAHGLQSAAKCDTGFKPAPHGVSIDVVDHGVGISREIMDKIWDPFFTTRAEGTGLGLSICRRIVEDHGGTIQVESKPGEGTVVSLTLPGWHGQRVAPVSNRCPMAQTALDKPLGYRQCGSPRSS